MIDVEEILARAERAVADLSGDNASYRRSGLAPGQVVAAGQAVITAPKNKYTPAQDAELGHDAASRRESVLRPWCRSPGAERRRLSEGHRVDPDYPLSCRSKS